MFLEFLLILGFHMLLSKIQIFFKISKLVEKYKNRREQTCFGRKKNAILTKSIGKFFSIINTKSFLFASDFIFSTDSQILENKISCILDVNM